MMSYEEFLRSKAMTAPATGIDPCASVRERIAYFLFAFQLDLVLWALRRGRAAIFADTGLGKTRMQLAWAWALTQIGIRVLIFAPLAVAEQTVDEGRKVGIDVLYARAQSETDSRIVITNYEMREKFDPAAFGAVVLDESSILKDETSSTRNAMIDAFQLTPFRLACTATPSPNDFTELGNHAEFLGIMRRTEMLAMFFAHDGGSTQDWYLKGHARESFWRWVCSWAALVKRPSDLGYDDAGYDLPALITHQHSVKATREQAMAQGLLFAEPARTLAEQRNARRGTMSDRVKMASAIVAAEPSEPWIVWCELNDESSALASAIPGAVEIVGSDHRDTKVAAARWFSSKVCECGEKSTTIDVERGTRPIQYTEQDARVSRSRMLSIDANTCANISKETLKESETCASLSSQSATQSDAISTPQMKQQESERGHKSESGKRRTRAKGSRKGSSDSESHPMTTIESSPIKAEYAASAAGPDRSTLESSPEAGCTSTTATGPESSEGSCAPPAISDSASSAMTPIDLIARCSICGGCPGRRVLVSKCSIFGYGMNLQVCARMIFVGVSHSFEQFYQAVRRCWRFGQKRDVHAHLIVAELEGAILENLRRKERDAAQLSEEMRRYASAMVRENVRRSERETTEYNPQIEMTIPSWLRTEAA